MYKVVSISARWSNTLKITTNQVDPPNGREPTRTTSTSSTPHVNIDQLHSTKCVEMADAHTSSAAVRDIIVHPSRTLSSPYHIFFLPGNPGLVEYYAGFLESLHQSLNKDEASPGFHVSGCSFAGFETSPSQEQKKLYTITEQTDFALEKLRQCITNNSNSKPKVVLIGHSFGTFVATEMMKRIQTEQLREAFDVVGCVLLFPPIPDLEMSPRGSKLAVSLSLSLFRYLFVDYRHRHFCVGDTCLESARRQQDWYISCPSAGRTR